MTTATATLTGSSFTFISDLVRERSAIVLEPGKSYLVESRLSPVAREQGLHSVDELVDALRRPGAQALTRKVVEAMTTNETSFFRDLHPFEALKTSILPELINNRARERTLSIWSNACSSGQEVYTIAMILREHFPQLTGWKVRLIASDLSTQILAKARQGIFNQTEVNRGLPLPMLLKYFQKSGLTWQVKDEIRNMVEFCEINLVEAWPVLPPMDVIFLRNVLIYFSPETKKEILGKARQVLRPDGYMFLGGAETTMNLDSAFDRVTVGKATCYRIGKPC
ncbi:MAG: protein-glutamate O-methyltransferase CheR [Pirellulaceae bacterium]|nr:protein-glutamate O-methyltransferase CheR [Pirellulaceae bacterium]